MSKDIYIATTVAVKNKVFFYEKSKKELRGTNILPRVRKALIRAVGA